MNKDEKDKMNRQVNKIMSIDEFIFKKHFIAFLIILAVLFVGSDFLFRDGFFTFMDFYLIPLVIGLINLYIIGMCISIALRPRRFADELATVDTKGRQYIQSGAVIFSFFVPGSGQFILGQRIRGIWCFGIYLCIVVALTWIYLTLPLEISFNSFILLSIGNGIALVFALWNAYDSNKIYNRLK